MRWQAICRAESPAWIATSAAPETLAALDPNKSVHTQTSYSVDVWSHIMYTNYTYIYIIIYIYIKMYVWRFPKMVVTGAWGTSILGTP